MSYWNRVDWIRRKLEKNPTEEGKEQAISSLLRECDDENPYAQRILHELQKKFGEG